MSVLSLLNSGGRGLEALLMTGEIIGFPGDAAGSDSVEDAADPQVHRARSEQRLLTALRSDGDSPFDPTALAAIIGALGEGEAVEIRYVAGVKPKDIALAVDVEAVGSAADTAKRRAAAVAALVDVGLDLACPHLHFGDRGAPRRAGIPSAGVYQLCPPWQILSPAGSRGARPVTATPPVLVAVAGGLAPPLLSDGEAARTKDRAVLFDRSAMPPGLTPDPLVRAVEKARFSATASRLRLPVDPLLKALQRIGLPVEVVFRFEASALRAHDRRTLRNAARRLAYAPPHRWADVVQGEGRTVEYEDLSQWLRLWLEQGTFCRCRCFVVSNAPLPETVFSVIGHVVFGQSVTEWSVQEPADALDLRGATPGSLPALYPFPSARMIASLGFPRTAPRPPRFHGSSGLRLGHTDDGQPVHLAKADRARHTYVIGATGTGKSTLLLNMIRQDMAAGEGVVVIDPHGDLFADARRAVPAHRESDVVVVDFADFEHPVAVNLLEIRGEHREIAQNFICNELMRIFTRVLYRGVPEAFGPMFEAYFRNSLLLLMQGGGDEVTLVDLERVFADDAFRERLLTNCGEGHVTRFWRGIAGRVTHQDHSLMNMAPYIVSKVTQFTSNALIRPIISQPRSTVDFRGMLDEQKIILVNLAKGLLGELDSALLGMLVLGKIYLAALGRANVARDRRKPANLFIDEFQNIATESLGAMMSEGRKFGLCVTLANQTLSQIDGRDLATNLAGPILANAANLIVFRVGVPDAEMLACWTRPAIDKDMLAQLPDFHAAARILHRGRPLPPFLLASDPAP